MKVVFLGTSTFSLDCLKALFNSKHKILAVICQPDKPSGRGNKLKAPEVKEFALENNIPVYQFDKIRKEGVEVVKELKPDILAVAAYGQILSQEILDIALPINVHGSLLPKYRGASPIQTALLNGDKETGISIMKMSFEVDAGDVYLQEKLAISSEDNSETLFDKMGKLGGKLLVKTLDLIESNSIEAVKQDETKATFTSLLKKENAKINFSNSAESVVNHIRGYYPYAYFERDGLRFKVFSAKLVEDDSNCLAGEIIKASNKDGLIIKCADKAVEIIELQAPNSKRMLAKAYLNGKTIK